MKRRHPAFLRHTEAWYDALSINCGHRGYVTLAEIIEAEDRS